MSFFRMLFVLVLCLPIAYLAMRLVVGMINRLNRQIHNQKMSGGGTRPSGSRRNNAERSVHNRRRY